MLLEIQSQLVSNEIRIMREGGVKLLITTMEQTIVNDLHVMIQIYELHTNGK